MGLCNTDKSRAPIHLAQPSPAWPPPAPLGPLFSFPFLPALSSLWPSVAHPPRQALCPQGTCAPALSLPGPLPRRLSPAFRVQVSAARSASLAPTASAWLGTALLSVLLPLTGFSFVGCLAANSAVQAEQGLSRTPNSCSNSSGEMNE